MPDTSSFAFPRRRIVLGVGGSISAVGLPESVLVMRHALGLDVRAIMTAAATTLVAPRALAVVTGHPVALDESESTPSSAVAHMHLGTWGELMLVLPATANILAKAAHGIADDLLGTAILAAQCPIVFAPAMNASMWSKAAVQRNVATLRDDGYGVVPPVPALAVSDGQMAGAGLRDIGDILDWTTAFLADMDVADGGEPAEPRRAGGGSPRRGGSSQRLG
jgi:phosphopantothenoylcysteine synthetase/decarboxylase